jgi:hypothetical protein
MNRFQVRILIAILCLITVRAVGAPLEGAEFRAAQAHFSEFGATDAPVALPLDDEELEVILNRAEARATEEGRAILQKGRSMIKNGDVVIGSCWDFIHAVYTRAGYPTKKRSTAFTGKFKGGPYANPSDLQPGDWLYYVNHSYGDGEHSGIFVEWSDFATREALVMSYRGENSAVPGRYSYYDLSHVYNIIRPKGAPAVQKLAEDRQNLRTDSTLSRIDALLRQ